MNRKVFGRSPSALRSLLFPTEAGEKFDTDRLGIHWKINGTQTGGRFFVVPITNFPRARFRRPCTVTTAKMNIPMC